MFLWGLVCAFRALGGTQSGPRNVGGVFVGPGVRLSRPWWDAEWASQCRGCFCGAGCASREREVARMVGLATQGRNDAKPGQQRNTINSPYPHTRESTRDIYAN
ncbi:hypothetical protein StoSoilB22_11750 [Arthrobacter sp. StoSoilB22]|nr:hypothetical protein StoSoilB22_11750 [Arthrobacter sp. StoSoilB22]